VLVFSSF